MNNLSYGDNLKVLRVLVVLILFPLLLSGCEFSLPWETTLPDAVTEIPLPTETPTPEPTATEILEPGCEAKDLTTEERSICGTHTYQVEGHASSGDWWFGNGSGTEPSKDLNMLNELTIKFENDQLLINDTIAGTKIDTNIYRKDDEENIEYYYIFFIFISGYTQAGGSTANMEGCSDKIDRLCIYTINTVIK